MTPHLERLRNVIGDETFARLFGPGIYALLIKIAGGLLSYLMLVAFARMLGANSYGQFGIMLNMSIVLATFIAIGLPTGIMRFWPGHLSNEKPAFAMGFHLSAQRLLVVMSAVALLIGATASYHGIGIEYFGASNGAFFVAALASTTAIATYYANALRAQQRVIWSMLPLDVVWRVGSPVLAGTFMWFAGALTATQSIASCVIALLCLVTLQGFISARTANRITGAVDVQTDWPMWRKPLVHFAGASMLFAMVQQLDVVVVGLLIDTNQAGAYFAAQKTASLLGLVMIAGGLVAAPLMSAAYHSGKRAELQKLCKMLAAAIAVTTLLGLLFLVFIGKILLGIFDVTYVNAYAWLLVLAVGFTIDALAGPTAYLMQMTSLESTYLRIMAMTYAMVLALQFALVPTYGPIAAALASAAGACVSNGLSIYYLRKSIGIDSSLLSFFLPSPKM
jgi:O-antigen/teichoic acid export membrane protein